MSVRKGSNIIAIGNVQVDGDTTSFNSNHSLQAIGTKNKNTESSIVGIYDWVGTKDEYTEQNVAVLHPDWICFITDDEEMDIENYYTKTATDDRFAHRDADNFTSTGTTFLSRQSMPSNRYEEIELLTTGNTYTAPANGMFVLMGKAGSSTIGPAATITSSNGVYCSSIRITSVMNNKIWYLTHWVRAGDVVTITWESSALIRADSTLSFVYADGNPTNS